MVIRSVFSHPKSSQLPCEDFWAANNDFVVVADGVSSKSHMPQSGINSGRIAAESACSAVLGLEENCTARQAVDVITASVAAHCCREAAEDVPSPGATVAIYSRSRRQIWIVGDCQCLLLLNGLPTEHRHRTFRIDRICAEARSIYLHAVNAGFSVPRSTSKGAISSYCDPGRAIIRPLLDLQHRFANEDPPGPFSYAVVNGTRVPDYGIDVVNIPEKVDSIVLATDGYPELLPTLEASEERLRAILDADPLMYRTHPSTKGAYHGFSSFDDRTFVRIDL